MQPAAYARTAQAPVPTLNQLYGLRYAEANAEYQVVVCQGQAAADVLNALLDKLPVAAVAYVGADLVDDAEAIDLTDWAPLAGRSVVIVGGKPIGEELRLMLRLRGMGCVGKICWPDADRPDGWTVASHPWADQAELLAWLKAAAVPWPDAPDASDAPENTVESQNSSSRAVLGGTDSPDSSSLAGHPDDEEPDIGLHEPKQGEPPEWLSDAPDGPLSGSHGDYVAIPREHFDRPSKAAAEALWGDPLDLSTKLYEGLPFNPAWLPGPLGAFTADVAARMGGDPGAVAIGVLAACAGLADGAFYCTPKLHDTKWHERPCFWGLAVGASATKKTWLVEAGLKPVSKIDAALTRTYGDRMKNHTYAMEQYAETRRNAVKNGLPRPEEPEKPLSEQIMLNDFTVEAIRSALLDSPRGILIYRDEFAGTIADLDRYSAKGASGDRYSILELHNGGTKKIGRVGNFMTVPNWDASIAGCLTPTSLKAKMADMAEDGLLQRFMICNVRPAGDDEDRLPDFAAESAYLAVLNGLREQVAMPDQPIRFSPDAYALRMEFQAKANALASAPDIPGSMASALRKWEGLFPRLCCLFHLIHLAQYGQHPGQSESISADTAGRVSDLLLHWQYSHLQEFYLDVLGAGGSSFALKIANYILAHEIHTLSHRDHVTRPHFNAWAMLSQAEKAGLYVTLENAGWVVKAPQAKINQDKLPSHWEVNPAVHKKFRLRATQERERREEVIEEIRVRRENALQLRPGD